MREFLEIMFVSAVLTAIVDVICRVSRAYLEKINDQDLHND
jgi:hypothetical protein